MPPFLAHVVLELVSLCFPAILFPVVAGLVPQDQLAFLLFLGVLLWCPLVLCPLLSSVLVAVV